MQLLAIPNIIRGDQTSHIGVNVIDNPPHAGNGYSCLGTDKIHREHFGVGRFERDAKFNDTVVRYLDESVICPR